MEFHYEVTIKGSNGVIAFTMDEENKNDTIVGVDFKFNSNNSAKERDRNGRIEIIVYGLFDGRKENLTAIRELAEWAKSKEDVYREVTIELKTNANNKVEGNFKRTYHFDKMFCIDYCERTGSAMKNNEDQNSGLEFELLMAQAPTFKISETKAENE